MSTGGMLGRLRRLLTGEVEIVFDDDEDLMKVRVYLEAALDRNSRKAK
jgi:hypothetical protein